MDWLETHDSLLREFLSHKRIGVVTDMDGTLSVMAPTPGEAVITPRNHDLLRELHEKLALVAVVSGRGVADLRERVGLPELTYVGNHGLEMWENGRVVVMPEAEPYRPALVKALDEFRPHVIPGMLVEDKYATASIHYRLTENPDAVRDTLAPRVHEIARRHGLKSFEGHRIFELRPPVEIDKGTAFQHLIRDHALDAAVFLGDDTTDADALRVARALRDGDQCFAIGVGVDASGTPASVRETADILVKGVAGVEEFLGWLSSAASASST